MKALLKIEWIQIWRQWTVFIMAIGMPIGFFIFYSGMEMSPDHKMQELFVRHYMLTMTGFSMSSFGFFSFPFMLVEDKTNHWMSYIRHSRLTMGHYYLSKLFRVLIYFICSIIVTFLVGAFYRQVTMSWEKWLGSGILLLGSSLVFLAFGLLISQLKSQQVMSIISNISFILLAIIGGSWMPIETFPDWMQTISKWTPVHHVNRLVLDWSDKEVININSILIMFVYVVLLVGITYFVKKRTEVN